jgi:homoserine kinase type II
MAVYTRVDRDILEEFLHLYDVGALASYEGVAAGVSNTNYFVTTDQGKFVLTLFEPHRVSEEDVFFFTRYTNNLYESGIPVPEIIKARDGEQIHILCGRPACLYNFLEGAGGHAGMVTPEICGEAGALLAHMHIATAHMNEVHPDPYGPDKWREWIKVQGEDIEKTETGLLKTCIETFNELQHYPAEGLTSGPIHGDYFPDNVFFKNGEAVGVIDFHFACTGWFLYDLAVAVNAWCFDENNEFQQDRYEEMMAAYRHFMPLDADEYNAMPMLLKLAALRFLLSRIEEKAHWTADRLGKPHDPLVFLKRLEFFRERD